MGSLVKNNRVILFILLSGFILQTISTSVAQEFEKSSNSTNIKLYEAIDQISKKFETSFSYNPQTIPNVEIEWTYLEGQRLGEVLNEVLSPLGIGYTIEGKTIAIYFQNQKIQNSYITITGRVIDKLTREPIPGVNVYISNTFDGQSTNIDGEFKFTTEQSEVYEIVASHVSYEPLVKNLSSLNNNSKLIIELEENVQKLDELVVKAPTEKEWNNYLRIFKREFLGTSRNARKCEIVNPEVIHFSYDSINGLLQATSDELLIIRNESLGYNVSHLLVLFEFQFGKVRYVSKPKFERLTTDNRRQELRWEKSRREVYSGSFAHFIKSLNDNNLKSEGFNISTVTSLGYDMVDRPIKRDEVFKDSVTTKILDFNNYLVVQYRELEDRDYQLYRQSTNREMNGARMSFERHRQQYQVSILELNTERALIQDGHLLDPMSITQHGYWGWKRNSDLLPYNYTP